MSAIFYDQIIIDQIATFFYEKAEEALTVRFQIKVFHRIEILPTPLL